MPQIINDEKQQAALKSIEDKLALVETLNTALGEGAVFSITATPKTGKAVKIDIEEKDAAKIVAMLDSNKKKLAKDILATAKANRIALSDKESETLK